MDFVSSEESHFWKQKSNEFICDALAQLCGKEFSKCAIMIKSQECFAGTNNKYFVSLDVCHDITHVFDANQEIYKIPAVKALCDERAMCIRTIQETKSLLTKIENESYHLGNTRSLNSVIETLFQERVEQLPKLRETIKKNEERIKKIKKELTAVFAEFLRKHD
jgi:hypothetical protein